MAQIGQRKVKMFDNKIMEALFKSYPRVHFTLWIAMATYFLYRAIAVDHIDFAHFALAGVGATFYWMIFEYASHRWIYHMNLQSPAGKRLVFILHEHHHQIPEDVSRCLAPTLPALGTAIVGYLLQRWVLGPVNVDPFFSIVSFIYVGYEMTHYALHAYTFKSAMLKRMKRFHMIHHYTNAEVNFGVTNFLVDAVMNTQVHNLKDWRPKSSPSTVVSTEIPVRAA